tara:strand:+ start:11613 stop:11972 length:360 start_codon:yes stop_codon:yes gene_type:complete
MADINKKKKHISDVFVQTGNVFSLNDEDKTLETLERIGRRDLTYTFYYTKIAKLLKMKNTIKITLPPGLSEFGERIKSDFSVYCVVEGPEEIFVPAKDKKRKQYINILYTITLKPGNQV